MSTKKKRAKDDLFWFSKLQKRMWILFIDSDFLKLTRNLRKQSCVAIPGATFTNMD